MNELVCATSALAILIGTCGTPSAVKPDDLSGNVVATIDGREINLPLLKADYDIDIEGDIARVSLTQEFVNPTDTPLNATYLFPMNRKAAIHAMRMVLDDEVVEAEIQRTEQAKATFEQAKSEGKAAALLTQHRPNMFTQEVANLMPGRTVEITIDYVQTVPKIDGAYELVVPMVVGPRYERAPDEEARLAGLGGGQHRSDDWKSDLAADGTTEIVSGWQIDRLPAYPPVIGFDAPGDIDPKRVGLDLTLSAPIPVSAVWSDSHDLAIAGTERTKAITFRSGRSIDNRDLVVRYELAAEKQVATGLTSYFDEDRGGFYSLLIEPPKLPDARTIAKRELVFVLDTSGSMSGEPMQASKTFMRAAITALRPDDHFRILRFSDNTSAFAASSQRATAENKRSALNFVNGLSAGGGTEMERAINAAFDAAQPANTMRIVVFLTDGYIGADRDVIGTVSNRIGKARIYAFGIGDSVNRFLLDGMAREGRGYARYVQAGESDREAAEAFAANLKSPLLTDISVDWNGLEIDAQTPAGIPDLFEGGAVRVMGRYARPGTHRIFVEGHVNGRRARLPLEIELAGPRQEAAAGARIIPVIWAREQIFDKNRAFTIGGGSDDRLKEEITRLGLDFRLQSRFTSFVAVSRRIVNQDPANAVDAAVPLPKASRVSTAAYPTLNLSGSSAPEPEGIVGLMVLLLAAAARYRRRLGQALSRLVAAARRIERDTRLPRSVRRDGWWLE